ncbi:MAG TPA: hypothetical protein DCS84_10550, partial [Microbacterium sp.]|nr:hypothetical protein [Microbacterium sp.]
MRPPLTDGKLPAGRVTSPSMTRLLTVTEPFAITFVCARAPLHSRSSAPLTCTVESGSSAFALPMLLLIFEVPVPAARMSPST